MLKKVNCATMEQPLPDGNVAHVAVDLKEPDKFYKKDVERLLNNVVVEEFKMEIT